MRHVGAIRKKQSHHQWVARQFVTLESVSCISQIAAERLRDLYTACCSKAVYHSSNKHITQHLTHYANVFRVLKDNLTKQWRKIYFKTEGKTPWVPHGFLERVITHELSVSYFLTKRRSS